MKRTILLILVVVSFGLAILSLFSSGPLRFFGFPISGALFWVAARAMLSQLDKD